MRSKSDKVGDLSGKMAIMGVLLLYFCSMVFLHYQQLNPDELAKGMLSDLPAHLRMAQEGTAYSLSAIFLKLTFDCFGNVGVAVLLSIVQILTAYVVALWFKSMTQAGWPCALAIALGCCVEMALHGNGQRWYLGTITGSIYHNSTYTFMQIFAVLAFIFFLRLYRDINGKISKKYWIIYTILLTLTTVCKPSFLFGFAPTLLVFLIFDFLKTKGHNLFNEILIGITVFPGAFVGILQSAVLYPEDSTSKIIFAPFAVWSYFTQNTEIVSMVRSLLFVLIVLAVVLAMKGMNKTYVFSLSLLLVTILEALFLAESGPRQHSGNIFWTAYSAMMICFTVSAAMLYNITKEQFKSGTGNTLVKGSIVLGWIAFAGHVLCGCTYIFLQITGQYML